MTETIPGISIPILFANRYNDRVNIDTDTKENI